MNLNSNEKRRFEFGMCGDLKFLTPIVKVSKFPDGLVYQQDSDIPKVLEIGSEKASQLLNRVPNKDTLDTKTDLPLDGTQKISDKKKAEQQGQGMDNDDNDDRIFGTKILNYGFETENESSSNSSDENSDDDIEPLKKKSKMEEKCESLFNLV